MTLTEPLTDPRRYVHRRTFVESVRYSEAKEGPTIAAWVVHTGGEATVDLDGLLVKTQVKWVRVPIGFWIGRGYIGQYWVISNEVHAGCYEPVVDGNYLAVLDRDTAAAMVVAADDLADAAERDATVTGVAYGAVEQLRTYVHQLAATAEALR